MKKHAIIKEGSCIINPILTKSKKVDSNKDDKSNKPNGGGNNGE